MDGTRVDQWLWAIRLCSTRSQATAACRAGHVRVNDRPAKPATVVDVGDRVQAYVHEVHRTVEVVRPIQKRVGAPVAVECYVDHTPPPPPPELHPPLWERPRGAGRPTKRDRRQMDRFRGRDA
jgi:ribosome-associated heat shock protein Hsp15